MFFCIQCEASYGSIFKNSSMRSIQQFCFQQAVLLSFHPLLLKCLAYPSLKTFLTCWTVKRNLVCLCLKAWTEPEPEAEEPEEEDSPESDLGTRLKRLKPGAF